MATVTFILKEPLSKEPTLIYLICRYGRRRLKYSTREKILPKYWNGANMVRKSFPGAPELNDYLYSIETSAKSIYRQLVTDGMPIDNETLKKELDKNLSLDPGNKKSLQSFFLEFMEARKDTTKPRTNKKFRTLLNLLNEYQKVKRVQLDFNSFTKPFYNQFVAFLISRHSHLNNTISKYIAALKTFLGWATELGYNQNKAFKKYKAPQRDADIIYLTAIELDNLYKLDLSGNPRLAKVRDVFCFGCFTGLRYSDLNRLRKENIKKGSKRYSIHLTTEKTMDNLIIPIVCNEPIEILERNNYRLPSISNQKMNEYLKELGKLAGFDEVINITKYSGINEIREKKPKYELLSTHDARRTFITLSLEKGMRPETVMKITGHKDYKTFKKYIKLTDQVLGSEMELAWGNIGKLAVVR